MQRFRFCFSRGWRRISLAACGLLCLLAAAGCQKKAPAELLQEANAMFQAKDVMGAENLFEQLVEKHPDAPEALSGRMGLAACYQVYREMDRSREQLDLVIKESGGPQTAAGNRALLIKLDTFMNENKPEKALAEAEATSASLRGAPDTIIDQFQWKLAGLYLVNKQNDKALAVYQALLANGPAIPDRQFDLLGQISDLYAAKNDWDAAIRVLDEFAAAHPDAPFKTSLLFRKAMLLQGKGDTEQSQKLVSECAGLIQQQIDQSKDAQEKSMHMMELAAVQSQLGKGDEARKLLNEVIAQNPGTEQQLRAQFQMAKMEKDAKNPQAAISVLEQVIQANPNTKAAAGAKRFIEQIQAEATSGTAVNTLTTATAHNVITTPTAQSPDRVKVVQ